MAFRVVVIGGGAAGIGAAGGAKAADPATRWSSTPSSRTSAYSPCGIPYVHGKEIPTFESLFLADEGGLRRRGHRRPLRDPVVDGVRPPAARSSTSRARARSPTTGSSSPPASTTPTPGFPASSLGGLYYVKNIRAGDGVGQGPRRCARRPWSSRPAPLGAGDGDRAARTAASTPTWSTPSPWALVEVADPDIVAPVEESWAEMGVQMHFNTRLEAFLGREQLRAGPTSGGELAADLAVICTHKVPNIRLAVAAGLKVGIDRRADRGRADGAPRSRTCMRPVTARDPARRLRRPVAGPVRVATPTPRARWRALNAAGGHAAVPRRSTSPGGWSPASG